MSKFIHIISLFTTLAFGSTALADTHKLLVQISGATPPEGTVEISVFNSAETFLSTAYMQQSGQVTETGEYVTVFDDVPSGTYAVVVVHDANDNGKLDSGFLGLWGESYSFSNQAKSWFGRPDFEDAAFTMDSDWRVPIQLDD